MSAIEEEIVNPGEVAEAAFGGEVKEDQLILRLPPAVSDAMREMIASREFNLDLQFHSATSGTVTFPAPFGRLPFALKNLPTIVETHHSPDSVATFKSADIHQVLVVSYPEDHTGIAAQQKEPLTLPSGLGIVNYNIVKERLREKQGKKPSSDRLGRLMGEVQRMAKQHGDEISVAAELITDAGMPEGDQKFGTQTQDTWHVEVSDVAPPVGISAESYSRLSYEEMLKAERVKDWGNAKAAVKGLSRSQERKVARRREKVEQKKRSLGQGVKSPGLLSDQEEVEIAVLEDYLANLSRAERDAIQADAMRFGLVSQGEVNGGIDLESLGRAEWAVKQERASKHRDAQKKPVSFRRKELQPVVLPKTVPMEVVAEPKPIPQQPPPQQETQPPQETQPQQALPTIALPTLTLPTVTAPEPPAQEPMEVVPVEEPEPEPEPVAVAEVVPEPIVAAAPVESPEVAALKAQIRSVTVSISEQEAKIQKTPIPHLRVRLSATLAETKSSLATLEAKLASLVS